MGYLTEDQFYEELSFLWGYEGQLTPEAKELMEENKDHSIDFLMNHLTFAHANLEFFLDGSRFQHIYSSFLLAEFQIKEAYPLVIKFLYLDHETIFDLFGDYIHEDFPSLLATFAKADNNNALPIIDLAKDETVDFFVRDSAIRALGILTLKEHFPKNDFIALSKNLLDSISHPTLLAFFCLTISDMGLTELKEDVKYVFSHKVVDESVVEFQDLEFDAKRVKEDTHWDFVTEENTMERLNRFGWLDQSKETVESVNDDAVDFSEEDIEKYLSMFDTETSFKTQEPVKNPYRDVGRNDPCPCGSGKKYKKCCLKKQK